MCPKELQGVNPSIRSIGVLSILLLILTTVSPGFTETLQSAPTSKAFVDYLDDMLETISSMEIAHQETQVGRPTKLIPSPIDRPHQKGLSVTPPQEHLMKAMVSVMNTPPASYDLKTLGRVTPVRDQGSCGS
jgi:C1A family cysteine protease